MEEQLTQMLVEPVSTSALAQWMLTIWYILALIYLMTQITELGHKQWEIPPPVHACEVECESEEASEYEDYEPLENPNETELAPFLSK